MSILETVDFPDWATLRGRTETADSLSVEDLEELISEARHLASEEDASDRLPVVVDGGDLDVELELARAAGGSGSAPAGLEVLDRNDIRVIHRLHDSGVHRLMRDKRPFSRTRTRAGYKNLQDL